MSAVGIATHFTEAIKRLIRPCYKISLELASENEIETSRFTSNFNGIPYLEQDEFWPVNQNSGKPLDFVFQIVNDGRFPWPNYIKLLQFYYDWSKKPKSWKHEGWLVKSYPEVVPMNSILPSYRPEKPFCKPCFEPAYSLPSWDSLDSFCSEATFLAKNINREYPWEVYEQTTNRLIGQAEVNSFIGGYPQWIQGDVTPTFGDFRSRLLIQVDSSERAEIEWPNNGSLYLFFHHKKPHDFGFVLQEGL